ncbi:tRNA guanosine(34) transglycosylase Tgt [Candidatus Kaiserbacteria bacterium CG10_big_fil_rev_8_21_14_0_10_45_20]|uniref:Queuine tRNA-ribosyltransferase n=1 Tax=Candidatus Kaiserbacteria bacterium CG10_big_fil_rev_8_21_14_0_10_45_20 TaxID=1974607 RepID=A0A2H0UGQ4_9BACT|nr:MAG: tRNA guanosine(34) transglycosylase Tgt [Candidatus Kaiserbacteria bacterium CG10_big_fil_rev_8_21_14_0_10_45_20]
MSSISFRIEKSLSSGARAGVIETPHGVFQTPAFCVVGTKGTVKSVLPIELVERAKVQVALANTYHLFLQPGEEVVREAGGLHSFMDWHGPLITDSGGFQVFSLGAGFEKGISKFATQDISEKTTAPSVYDEDIRTQHGKLAIIDDEGVSFTSHIDGTLYRFTPERSVEIQHALGADIFFAFDECTSPSALYEYQREAGERTHRWAERSLKAHRANSVARKKQALFGVVQGGRYTDLRAWSAKEIGEMGFDGFGIGGSFSKDDLGQALTSAIEPLPPEAPRHLLGIGEPADLFEGVSRGIDMFDCVLPTRLARNGTLYTRSGKINILNEKYIRDFSPLDSATGGYASEHFTKAYLAHLFRAKEMLAATIASLHNIYFIQSLVHDICQSILEDRFDAFRADFLRTYLN